MSFSINDSPFAGNDGDKVTSRLLAARLARESEGNVPDRNRTRRRREYVRGQGPRRIAARRADRAASPRRGSNFRSRARGCCTDKIPIPARAKSRWKRSSSTSTMPMSAPWSKRWANVRVEMTDMRPSGGGKTRVVFVAPARGLIGYHGQFLNDTRGTGVMSRLFHFLRTPQGCHPGAAQRRADLECDRQVGPVRALEPGGPRRDVHRRRGRSLRRHDHRRAQPRQRP